MTQTREGLVVFGLGIVIALMGMAMELDAAIIFTSEHSDKTRGSIREMRRATEMMAVKHNGATITRGASLK